jgi:hypothetical protein
LALGLKKETADMHYRYFGRNSKGEVMHYSEPSGGRPSSYDVPAWSLHRLIELKQPNIIDNAVVVLLREQTYDKLIGMIAKSIKEGYFNKEYLEV